MVISAIPEEWLLETRKRTKDAFIHWIFADETRLEAFARMGNAGVSLNIPDAFAYPQEKIAAVHELGLRVCLRAGDSIASVKRMAELGLDYIPTNCMHLPLGQHERRSTNEIQHHLL